MPKLSRQRQRRKDRRGRRASLRRAARARTATRPSASALTPDRRRRSEIPGVPRTRRRRDRSTVGACSGYAAGTDRRGGSPNPHRDPRPAGDSTFPPWTESAQGAGQALASRKRGHARTWASISENRPDTLGFLEGLYSRAFGTSFALTRIRLPVAWKCQDNRGDARQEMAVEIASSASR